MLTNRDIRFVELVTGINPSRRSVGRALDFVTNVSEGCNLFDEDLSELVDAILNESIARS